MAVQLIGAAMLAAMLDPLLGSISTAALKSTLGKEYKQLEREIQDIISKDANLLSEIQQAMAENDNAKLRTLAGTSAFGSARVKIMKQLDDQSKQLKTQDTEVKDRMTKTENQLTQIQQGSADLGTGSFTSDMVGIDNALKEKDDLINRASQYKDKFNSQSKTIKDLVNLKGKMF